MTSTSTSAPRVFLSHAGEDRAFTEDLAGRLRGQGIEPWYSGWEIVPGDSLVRKIFDEGLGQADVLVVVLSRASVDKPWVRKELDVATMSQIEKGFRIVPLVIEDCEVPTSLRDLFYLRIADRNDYGRQFEALVASLHGHRPEKPPLGPAPIYVQAQAAGLLPGLPNAVDSFVLGLACELAVEACEMRVDTSVLLTRARKLGLPDAEYLDSLEVLEQGNHILASHALGRRAPIHFRILPTAFDCYAQARVEGYPGLRRRVAAGLLNQPRRSRRPAERHLGRRPGSTGTARPAPFRAVVGRGPRSPLQTGRPPRRGCRRANQPQTACTGLSACGARGGPPSQLLGSGRLCAIPVGRCLAILATELGGSPSSRPIARGPLP